jgi:hypothetical protein
MGSFNNFGYDSRSLPLVHDAMPVARIALSP